MTLLTNLTMPFRRPLPGTHEEGIYTKLLCQMSRAGRAVDFGGCVELAEVIQREGHRSSKARRLAKVLGLNPRYLPRRHLL